jgi:hypothetical protein
MSKVIKEAFVEGRQTDVSWNESEAKRNQIKLDVFTSNVNNFNGRKFMAPMSLQQVDPNTGNVLRTFPSRIDAARWICKNVLKRLDTEDKKALSITGNMHMCITNGWKAYGYFWKYVETKNVIENENTSANARAVWIHELGKHRNLSTRVVSSIAEAVKITNVSKDRIRRVLDNNGGRIDGYVFSSYNEKPMSVEYKSVLEASRALHLNEETIKRYCREGVTVNNITINIPNISTKKMYCIYMGRTLIKQLSSKAEVASELHVSRAKLSEAVDTNIKVNGYTIRTKYVDNKKGA